MPEGSGVTWTRGSAPSSAPAWWGGVCPGSACLRLTAAGTAAARARWRCGREPEPAARRGRARGPAGQAGGSAGRGAGPAGPAGGSAGWAGGAGLTGGGCGARASWGPAGSALLCRRRRTCRGASSARVSLPGFLGLGLSYCWSEGCDSLVTKLEEPF